MAGLRPNDFEKLSEAVQHMQRCLECRICLHTVSSPMKTRCGHCFCRVCIGKVLDKKKASCPLCKTSLKRRSVSSDEHMEQCVDRFQKLITAIQADSGVDILSLSKKHQHTKESSSSDVSHNEPNAEQNAPASRKSSDSTVGLQSENNSSNRRALRSKRASGGTGEDVRGRNKTDRRNSEASSTARDLFQYGFAGGPTAHTTDDSNNCQTSAVTKDKVQSWLQTITPCELPDDTNRAGPIPQTTCPSDDVVTDAVPNTCSNSTDNGTDKTDSRPDREIRQQQVDCNEKRAGGTLKRRSFEASSQRENNRRGSEKGRKSRRSVETKNVVSTGTDLKFNAVHARVRAIDAEYQQRAGTSNAINFGDNVPLKGINSTALLEDTWSQGQSNEAHKVTPANMIPSAEQNWSSVVKFGRDMRKRKRTKLKSLNVSIENVNRSRRSGAVTEEGNVGSRLIKDVRQGATDNGRGSDCNMPESPANTRTANNRLLEENGGLPNIESTGAKARNTPKNCEEGTSPRNRSNVSVSEGSHRAAESSFITLHEGEQIHIRSLNSHQMNDIIGVSGESSSCQGTPNKNPPNNRGLGKSPLALKRRGDPSKTLSPPSQSTPVKCGPEVTDKKNSPCLSADREMARIRNESQVLSSPKSQSPELSNTPNRGRLSLRKKENDNGSRKSSYPNPSDISRLTAIKRDLSEQICPTKTDNTGNNASRLSSKVTGQQRSVVKHPPANLPRTSNSLTAGPNNATRRTVEGKRFVAFKKLGRVVKQRQNTVKFFYLGSTRRSQLKSTLGYTSITALQKPCNPIEVQTVPNFHEIAAAESGFLNDVQITPNDQLIPAGIDVSNQSSSNVSNIAAPCKKSVVPAETSRVAKELIKPVERKSSADAAASAKRFDVHDSTAPGRNSTAGCTGINKSRNSPNSVSATLREETEPLAEREATHSESVTTSEQRTRVNGIRMLSPEKDSQLKFLSMESPLSESLRAPKFMQRAEAAPDCSSKKRNFSGVKGAHTRALIRGTEEATSESSEPDTLRTPNRKRKRKGAGTREKHRSRKREDVDNNESDSDISFSSRITQVRKRGARTVENALFREGDNEVRTLVVNADVEQGADGPMNVQDADNLDAVFLSSDTDIIDDGEEGVTRGPAKAYKRVVRLSTSDTDSSEIAHASKKKGSKDEASVNGEDTRSSGLPISKRKRALPTDSDDDVDLQEIVHGWCNSIDPQERNSKRGRVDQVSVVSNVATNANPFNPPTNASTMKLYDERNTSSLDKDLFESDPIFCPETANPVSTGGHEVKGKGTAVNCEDDFNSIIDKVQAIQRSQNNPTSESGNKRSEDKELQGISDACLMQDNFDEIIANVDTQLIMNGYQQSEEIIPASEECRNSQAASIKRLAQKGPNKTSMPKIITDTNVCATVAFNSSGSDKENNALRVKGGRQDVSANLEDHLDKTLTPENPKNDSDKCREVLAHGCADAEEYLSDKTIVNAGPDAQETLCDQDSLMNVTQHQLFLKEFEEDLFGTTKHRDRIEASTNDALPQDDQQTPRKDKEGGSKYRHTHRKDTEHSGGEDDIVENTPDTKTKNSAGSVHSINSSARRNLTASDSTPGSKDVERPTTPSPLPMRVPNSTVHTPSSIKSIYPLYQSTPNVPRSAAKPGNAGTSTCTENRKTERVSNSSILCGMQSKDETARTVQTRESESRKLCFVCSGLVYAQIERVRQLAASYDAKYMNQFTREVTHVIVKTSEENNTASKTLKFLQGIAHRKWIVGYKWVIDCLKEKKLLNEEPYEVVDSVTLEAGPRKSRLREKGLFEDFVFFCYGPYVDVSVEQYKDLLLASGATVVETLEVLAAERKKLKMIVIETDIHDNKIIKDWYRKTAAVPILHDWVLECITQYKLISLYPYLQELLPEDVLALGFPEFLVEEEVDGDGDSMYEVLS